MCGCWWIPVSKARRPEGLRWFWKDWRIVVKEEKPSLEGVRASLGSKFLTLGEEERNSASVRYGGLEMIQSNLEEMFWNQLDRQVETRD